MKIVFQGDSITDAGRDKRNYHELGAGYPKFAAEYIRADFPETDFEFINFGISGNRTDQLFDRLYPDAIAFDPDIISILIGINDVWHRHGTTQIATTDAQIETNYRAILERLKNETHAKIVILCPFLLDDEAKESWRGEVDRVIAIVRGLAEEYADVYVPLDLLFEEALKVQPEPKFYSADGVHPNDNGRAFIGKHYAEAVRSLIEAAK